MERDIPLPQRNISRFDALIDFFIQWFSRYILTKIVDKLAKLLGPRLVKALKGLLTRQNLKRFGGYLWKVSPVAAIVLGFLFQQNVIWFSTRITLPLGAAIVAGVAVARVYFGFVAKSHFNGFTMVALGVGNRGWEVVIGGLSKAWYDLSLGLLPFWRDPWVFLPIGLYFVLIMDIVWLRRIFGRAARIGFSGPRFRKSP